MGFFLLVILPICVALFARAVLKRENAVRLGRGMHWFGMLAAAVVLAGGLYLAIGATFAEPPRGHWAYGLLGFGGAAAIAAVTFGSFRIGSGILTRPGAPAPMEDASDE